MNSLIHEQQNVSLEGSTMTTVCWVRSTPQLNRYVHWWVWLQ